MDNNNKKIAKNSLILYLRMFFVLGLGLISSRYILEALGIEEYGIYNVVAGVVTLFSFISVSMNSASSRFLATSIGSDDLENVEETFKAAFTVHVLIAVIFLLIAETVGLWLVLDKLVIPVGQYYSALIAYQIAIIIAIVSVIQTPFSATLIAYEKMGTYAGVELLNIILRFIAVLLLFWISSYRLIIYMIFLLSVSIIVFLTYAFLCRKSLPNLRLGLNSNRKIIIPMLSFSGWDLYGNMSVAARTQGVNILLNMFFGPVLNAASGLAGQIQSAIVSLSSNVVMAAKPQIVKSYAAGNVERCISLLINISKLTTALLLIVCVPIIVNIDYILDLWLKEVPIYTNQFAIWCIIFALVANLSTIIMSAIHATGKIKRSSLWNGTLYLLVLPISYFYFKSGRSPVIPFIINALAVTIGFSLNIFYLSKYIKDFKPSKYIKSAIFPLIITVGITFGCSFYLSSVCDEPLSRLLIVTFANLILVLACLYKVLLTDLQRKNILQLIRNYGK